MLLSNTLGFVYPFAYTLCVNYTSRQIKDAGGAIALAGSRLERRIFLPLQNTDTVQFYRRIHPGKR